MRKLYFFGLIALAAVIVGLAWADQMTFTTYYPAPFGVYRQMNVSQSLGLGDASGNNQWQISPTIGTDLQLNWTDNAGNSKTSITIEEPVSSAPSPALRIANNGDISMPNLTLDGSHLKIHEETEDTAQTAVGADYGVFYVDSTDNQPYYLDENGTKTGIIGTSAGQSIQVVGTTDISLKTTTWNDMPNMSITLDTSGDVLLIFSTTMQTAEAWGGNLSLVIDGSKKHEIAWEQGENQSYDAVAFQWLEKGLTSGNHTFKVQWKSWGQTISQHGLINPRVFTVLQL